MVKRLWAPWRMEYIGSSNEDGCIFCNKPKEGKDEENLILFRGKHCFVIMNRFPYNSGHVMVAPYRHVKYLHELSKEEFEECMELVKMMELCLLDTMSPHGFNFGANVGRDAGAGFEHLHFHLVPRWRGDTNYMPVIGEVKVLPEHLSATYRKLRKWIRKRHDG